MIPIQVIITLLVTHFTADFVLQSRYMGKWKSKSALLLLEHVLLYTGFFFFVGFWFHVLENIDFPGIGLFCLITGVTHFIIDYFTSRLGTKLWNQGKEYESLLVLGGDQMLHGIQLVLTYYFIFL